MKKSLIVPILLFTAVCLLGSTTDTIKSQEVTKIKPDRTFVHLFYNAEAYMYEENFEPALELLKKLSSLDPENPNIWYMKGFCLLNTRLHKNKAEKFLEKTVDYVNSDYEFDNHRERTVPLEALLYLGEAYRINYKFDLSLSAYYMLLELIDPDEKINEGMVKEIERQIEITNNAIYFTSNPVDAELRNLGSVINTKFTEHSPAVNLDETMLVFTSRRPRSDTIYVNQDEDIFVSKKENNVWQEPIRLGSPINTEEYNESVVGLSMDGTRMFFYRSEYDGQGSLYVTNSNDGINWSEPELLYEGINTRYNETHAAMSPDGNTIFFTSDRPGGHGGKDIYMIKKLPDGAWAEPQLLSEVINTPYDEEAPFIHPDGITLFFSSKGHNTMGGFDVFYSTMDEFGNFSEPVNLGYPINTPDDDVSYITNLDGRRAYIATVKDDGFGDMDIYEIFQEGIFKNNILVYEGVVTDINNNIPEDLTISVKDLSNKRPYGVYRPNIISGDYILALFPDRSYEVVYEAPGHLTHSYELTPTNEDFIYFSTHFEPPPLTPVMLQSYLLHDFVYFYESQSEITPEASETLDKVVETALTWDEVEYMIISISLPSIGVDITKNEERFLAIRNYLVENGVEKGRIYQDQKYPAGYASVYAVDVREYVVPIADLDVPVSERTDVVYSDTVEVNNVLFAFDSHEVRPNFFNDLNKLAAYLKNNPNARIEVGGHTDWIGSSEYNYLLSYKRAKAVKDYLVEKGSNPQNIIITKFGEESPIAANITSEGRRVNRRAEFAVIRQGTVSYLKISPMDIPDDVLATREAPDTKWTIQIFALRSERDLDYFADLVGVKLHVSEDGWYRYYVGEFSTRAEAVSALRNLEEMGYEPFIRDISFYKD